MIRIVGETALMLICSAGVVIGQAVPDVPGLGDPAVQWSLTGILGLTLGWVMCRTIPSLLAAAKDERDTHEAVVRRIVESQEKISQQQHLDSESLKASLAAGVERQQATIQQMIENCTRNIERMDRNKQQG